MLPGSVSTGLKQGAHPHPTLGTCGLQVAAEGDRSPVLCVTAAWDSALTYRMGMQAEAQTTDTYLGLVGIQHVFKPLKVPQLVCKVS